MKKDINYYMGLKYKQLIKKIPKKLGGGFDVSIPLLGTSVYRGCGDTLEEAQVSLRFIQKELFEERLRKGLPIPEPKSNYLIEYNELDLFEDTELSFPQQFTQELSNPRFNGLSFQISVNSTNFESNDVYSDKEKIWAA